MPARSADDRVGRALSPRAGRGGHRVLVACVILTLSGPVTLTRAADEAEKSVLGGILSKALSTPASRVSIGAVDGALSSDATIRDVAISDRDGVWLRLDRARIVWRRLALLSGRLEVDSLEVGRIEVLRRPVPAAAQPVEEPDGTLLPDLPVKVEVKAFRLDALDLGEAIAGQAARLTASGRVKLGNPAEGLDLDLGVRRLDAGGQFAARLLFVPKGERLEVKTTLTEPAGGLLSKGLSVPGEPPITLDLDGRGTLDAWNARLDFDAGAGVGAKGGAKISRIGAERRLSLDLAARVEGLLPGPAAAVFSGTTKLEGGLRIADSGALTLDRLELASRTARLEAKGTLDAQRNADVLVQARAVPTEGGVTKADRAEIASLVFDGSLKGPLARPRALGTLRAAGLRAADSALDRIEANLKAEPADANRFALAADAKVEGLRLADPALQRAIGGRAGLTFAGVVEPDNTLSVATLTVEAPTLKAGYAGRIGRNTLTGTVEGALPDLAVFSGLAGRALAGGLDGTAKLGGDPARKAVSAEIDLRAHDLALSEPRLDRLLGAAPRLTGRLATLYDGYGFEGVRLEGARMIARLEGQATARLADARAAIDLKDLAALDPRLGGRASLSGRLSGTLLRPDIAALVDAREASALGRPVRDLRAEAVLKDALGSPDGRVTLAGSVGGKALSGSLHLAQGGGDWVLDRLALSLGSASLTGQARLGIAGNLAESRAEGALALRAADLDDLSPLALTRLGGSLEADLSLARPGGRQDAALRARAAALRAGEIGLARLDANLTGRDLAGAPRIDGHVEADRLVAAGESLDTVRLTAVGGAEASDVTLKAKARGFDLDGAARLVAGPPLRVALQRFSAARGADRLALAAPATLTFADGAVAIDSLAVAAGSGRLTLAGKAGRDAIDLQLGIKALPLALARIASPKLALSGTLDGEASLHGPPERPEGRYAFSLAKAVTPETRKAGLPPVEARASGTLSEGRIGLDGRVSAGRGVDLVLGGSLPAETGGALALTARGSLDLALANSLLAAGGQRVTGRVAVDARVGGTLAAPRAEGSATLAGGSFTDPLQGIRLTNIEGRATGQGDSVVLERLSAATRNGGTLRAAGQVALRPGQGFPGSLRITGQGAELVSSPLVTAVAGLDLALSGPLAERPKVTGRIDLVSVDVTVPDRLPATVQPLPGIRRVNTTPEVRARLASRAQPRAAAQGAGRGRKAATPFDATLDVRVEAPNRIFVRGRGIDAELGGALRLTGSSRDPVAAGAFDLRRGRLAVIGQRLDFTRGRLTFGGELTRPDLDFLAETKASEITARIAVTGPANQPAFEISSEPSLPQDEVLSRLLFKKASGSLSPFQALQLAQAVSQLSGGAGGPDVFEATRKGLGLDSLDVSTGTSGSPAVGASRYLSDRLSVGVKAGAKPADTAATVDYDVTRRVKVQGEAGSDGRTSLGVGAEWEW
ncbi:translocation/assembly module TamB domain-containing protein [Methylobacterium dankookense]|uniref:translocation/assembly module TamB domain-containing protein n=1 Tax=Methylobacterium dankookense TaxID=560405 RepID=UPI00402BCECF